MSLFLINKIFSHIDPSCDTRKPFCWSLLLWSLDDWLLFLKASSIEFFALYSSIHALLNFYGYPSWEITYVFSLKAFHQMLVLIGIFIFSLDSWFHSKWPNNPLAYTSLLCHFGISLADALIIRYMFLFFIFFIIFLY